MNNQDHVKEYGNVVNWIEADKKSQQLVRRLGKAKPYSQLKIPVGVYPSKGTQYEIQTNKPVTINQE